MKLHTPVLAKRCIVTFVILIGFFNALAQPSANSVGKPVCKDTSLVTKYVEDSFHVIALKIANTADGNLVMAGVRMVSFTPYKQIGYVVKCKPNGDTVWVKNIADNEHHFSLQYTNIFELSDQSLLLFGQLNVPVPYNSRQDLVITHLTSNGDFIWQRSFVTPLYPGDSTSKWFIVNDAKSASDGTVYICGGVVHYGFSRESMIAKLAWDGSLLWSRGLANNGNSQFFGFNIVGNQLQAYGDGGNNSLCAVSFNATTGDTLYTKKWIVSPSYPEAFYRYFIPSGIVRLYNGNTVFYGRCMADFYYPYSGRVFHLGTLELDPSFNIVKGNVLVNASQGTFYNSRIAVYPDGSSAYSLSFGPYNQTSIIFGKMRGGQVVKERFIATDTIPPNSVTNFIQLQDGGDCIAHNVMANAQGTLSGIKLLRLHNSDISNNCLGTDTSITGVEDQKWQSVPLFLDSISRPVMAEVVHNNYLPENDGPNILNGCRQVSFCDSMKLLPSATVLCPGSPLSIRVSKNKECGARLVWFYDTTHVRNFSYLNDSTVQTGFSGVYEGYITAHIYGCADLADSIKITVLQAPASLDLGPDTTLCPSNAITLNAHKGYAHYLWQDGSTDSTFTITQPGTFFVQAADACGNTFKDTVRISAHSAIPLDLGPDRAKCNSDTLHLDAPAGFLNYSWSNNYNISSTTNQHVVVNPLTDTAYFLKAEKIKGCFAYDTVKINVNTSPAISLGTDKNFCNGDSTVFDAGSGFAHYLWSNGSNAEKITAKTTGSYSVIGTTSDGCKSYDTVRVATVFSNPVVSLDHNRSLCTSSSRVLDAGSFVSYLWNNGSTSQKITVSNTGTYSVQVTDNNGCKGTDTTIITTLLPLPSNFLPADTLLCSYDKLTLVPVHSYKSYQWSTGSTASSVTITQPGPYWLQVRDNNDCVGRDSIVINPKDCMKGIYVPTAFTPNRDGKNDVFRPLLFGNVKKYELTVYNRWGQIVFQTSDLHKAWDGTFAGLTQDSNVFVWLCSYRFEGEEAKTERGTVMLVR